MRGQPLLQGGLLSLDKRLIRLLAHCLGVRSRPVLLACTPSLGPESRGEHRRRRGGGVRGRQVLLPEGLQEGDATLQAGVRVPIERAAEESAELPGCLRELERAEQQRGGALQDRCAILAVCVHRETALLLQQLCSRVGHVVLAVVQTTNLWADLLEFCEPLNCQLHMLECCVALQLSAREFTIQEHTPAWEVRGTPELRPETARCLQHFSEGWGTKTLNAFAHWRPLNRRIHIDARRYVSMLIRHVCPHRTGDLGAAVPACLQGQSTLHDHVPKHPNCA
mmetsp:Transcript_18077/g.45081  ORF Transcript_18077/g.45081 Transcript_18077/m.45081 type:complete len:280 (+) Transcript_18077:408-1247(+)